MKGVKITMKESLSIHEFSKFSGIKSSTLRYWDDIGLFSPVKRDKNNYRSYSPQQITSVNLIAVLSYLRLPLNEINNLKQQRTPKSIINLLERQKKILDAELQKLTEMISVITTRYELINDGANLLLFLTDNSWDGTGRVSVMHKNAYSFILGPENKWKKDEPFYEPFMHFCDNANNSHINLNYPIAGYHEDMESFLIAPGMPKHFFSMDPNGNCKSKPGKYLTGIARGYYGDFGDLAEKMAAYAKENHLNINGPVYSIYLHDEICIKDPSKYLIHAYVAISE
ncbi:MAG: MerR family DNA-binding transcriptional regulator [Oscillospiraceae bacterium]|nr:MerR family DNA-binding transcriptional regulator [Oscillospiraceae bacterium]